jgi:DNA-binding HxlR family transcriptional regulator
VLNDRLRTFTRAGIFDRIQFPEIPPRVEYRLSQFGSKFLKLLKAVDELQQELVSDAKPGGKTRRTGTTAAPRT